MGATAKRIEIEVVGDTRSLEKALARSQKKTQSTFGKIGKSAGLAGAAIFAGFAVVAKVGFDELAEGQKVVAQTNAVIESTGGVANVTAGHVDDLAQSLSELTGIDDELVGSAENLLLTFKNVRNEAGKNNDIFDQATTAALDMSVAMGVDLQSAAVNVGKALNDPRKGLSRLTRMGVTFTDKQKKLIDRLVETGDTAGAQKVILKELTDEFGGSAKAAGDTLPGKLAKLRNAFDDTAGNLMVSLLPALTTGIGYLQRFSEWAQKNPGAMKVMAGVLLGIAAAFMAISVASAIATIAAAPWIALGVGIAVAIVGIGVAAVIAYKKFETFRNIVDGVISFVKKHWKLLLALIPVIGPLLAVVITKFKVIKSTASAVFGFVRDSVQWVIDKVQTLIDYVHRLIDAIRSIPVIGSIGSGSGSNMFSGGGAGPRGAGDQQGGFVKRSGLSIVHAGEQIVPSRVARGGAGSGGGGQFALVWAGPDFISWMREQDQRTRRGSGGRGIL